MNLEKIIGVRTKKTIYRDGDYVIKLFNKDYLKDMVLNEALNQARLETTDLPIPAINSVTMFNEKWAIVSEYIDGSTLSKLMDENPSKKDEYLDMFIDLQIKMHHTKAPILNDLFDKLKRRIETSDLPATQRLAMRLKLESMPKHYVICHGDFNPTNIIIDKANKPYILDWSHATLGNALADVAKTYIILTYEENIELANNYLIQYCNKTKTEADEVLEWVPIIATAWMGQSSGEYKDFLKTCL